jgi:hypothetical protein
MPGLRVRNGWKADLAAGPPSAHLLIQLQRGGCRLLAETGMMAVGERLEYLLPCGHKSVSLACFHCAIEEFLLEERAADKLKPAVAVTVPHELIITVVDPPHVQRFGIRGRGRRGRDAMGLR